MKTYSPKAKDVSPAWHLVDAKGKVLGRIASEIATLLLGKHKPTFAAHMVTGDKVVVINAAQVKVTGRKEKQKNYYRHSGYPGGLKVTPLGKMRIEHPERLIEHAVSGMLPKNKLLKLRTINLHVFANEDHPFTEKFK